MYVKPLIVLVKAKKLEVHDKNVPPTFKFFPAPLTTYVAYDPIMAFASCCNRWLRKIKHTDRRPRSVSESHTHIRRSSQMQSPFKLIAFRTFLAMTHRHRGSIGVFRHTFLMSVLWCLKYWQSVSSERIVTVLVYTYARQWRFQMSLVIGFGLCGGWSSDSTFACGARCPRIEPALRTNFQCVFTKFAAIRSFGHGLRTYCSA